MKGDERPTGTQPCTGNRRGLHQGSTHESEKSWIITIDILIRIGSKGGRKDTRDIVDMRRCND
jgi:hypothetical protein